MFYSHTIIAKKRPLGTVWITAHLERKIKKHQLNEIDVASYAECIMFPEVPIALRLSGHLLYGLVRIYSMKVKYLIQNCNRIVDDIRRVFTSVQVNLPGEADHAPFESLTLPSTFNLDAMELDYYPIK
ncbi:sister chromatid cohesion 1 protein 3-like [Asparagus officinalis]|nr:sister chromatid cohesion 1 protein 3-like [Asparagus officinalis]